MRLAANFERRAAAAPGAAARRRTAEGRLTDEAVHLVGVEEGAEGARVRVENALANCRQVVAKLVATLVWLW